MNIDLIIGSGIYLFVKFFGYRQFLRFLNRSLDGKSNPNLSAIVRILLGLAFGILFNLLVSDRVYLGDRGGHQPSPNSISISQYIGFLSLLRIVEWSILFLIFYRSKLFRAQDWLLFACTGAAVSLLLDLPVVFGFLTVIGGLC